jgi:hypothetical protein
MLVALINVYECTALSASKGILHPRRRRVGPSDAENH